MEIKKYDNKNYTILLEYNEFYSISIKYVEKFIKNIEILGKEICDYTDLYVINSQKKYSDNLNEFNKIISFLNDEKLKLENLKHNYFESCKNHIEQEQNLINIINSKNPNIENVKANKEILLKLKNLRENNEINYKLKIVNFNENLIKMKKNMIQFIIILKKKNQLELILFKIFLINSLNLFFFKTMK
jgi:exonuclease VII small subunit